MKKALLLCLCGGMLGVFPSSSLAGKSLKITGYEWGYRLSSKSISAGKVRITFINRGETLHDAVFRRAKSKRTYRFPYIAPGKKKTLTFRLKRGQYQLLCSLSGHAQLGMKRKFRVR